jgi:predicted phosphodiesterase
MRDPLETPDRIAFAGDWHMNTGYAEAAIKYAIDGGADLILHTGDFGWTFERSFLRHVCASLRVDDTRLLFVDGNHENYERLYGWPVGDDGLRQVYDRIFHLPRGFRWTWDGVRFLALGGAHSVDRDRRRPYVSWWPQEVLSAGDVVRAMRDGLADVMLSHDCPAGVDIPGLMPHLFAEAEIALAEKHRHLMRQVVDEVQPLQIYHGHYHVNYAQSVDLGWGPMQVTGLDCDGGDLAANVRLVNLDDLQRRSVRGQDDPEPADPGGPRGDVAGGDVT